MGKENAHEDYDQAFGTLQLLRAHRSRNSRAALRSQCDSYDRRDVVEPGLPSRGGRLLSRAGRRYQKASGNKIDYSLIPNAPLRQKEISAIQSGGVPDVMEVADIPVTPLNAWDDHLIDFDEIIETGKASYKPTYLSC